MTHLAIGIALLAALNVSSALFVVYTKHLSRQAYSEISSNQSMIDELEVQWSQLQIEEGTFSEHGRVERTARGRLGMLTPGLADSVMIAR